MRYVLAIFLVLTMLSDVAIAVFEQWQEGDLVEMNDCGTDDDASEKSEKGKETESYTLDYHFFIETFAVQSLREKKSFCFENDALISENHASLPELPPEA